MNKNFPLILASGSSVRKRLLQQIGIVPDLILPSQIAIIPKKKELPAIYAKRIATAKCTKLMNLHSNYAVLAAANVVACGRRILLKTKNADEANYCLNLLSGRQHRVYSFICLGIPKIGIRIKKTCTKIKFKRLSEYEITQYIASKEWQSQNGGYFIEGKAGMFVENINGSYSAIMGLPICETAKLLNCF